MAPIDKLKAVQPPPPPPPVAPTIKEPPFLTLAVGLSFSWVMETEGTRPLVLTAEPLPKGLVFEEGLLHGTPEEAGSYAITLTAQNVAGNDSKTLSLVIHPAWDHDGDRFPNDFETAFGSHADDPQSIPAQPIQGATRPLALSRLTLRFDFKTRERDALNLRALLAGTPISLHDSASLLIYMGGWAETISVKGEHLFATNGDKIGRLTAGKRDVPESLLLTLSFKRKDLLDHFADEGLLNESVPAPGKRVELVLYTVWDNRLYETRTSATYRARLAKHGVASASGNR